MTHQHRGHKLFTSNGMFDLLSCIYKAVLDSWSGVDTGLTINSLQRLLTWP